LSTFWFVTEKRKVFVEEFWLALGVPKHFMFWYSKKGSTKTLFKSLFLRCHWGCLYYKVLSLFSKTLFKAFSSTTTQTLAVMVAMVTVTVAVAVAAMAKSMA
jgi:hypothetical protein